MGNDGLSVKIIKSLTLQLADPLLVTIINKMFIISSFPKIFKIAVVTPIFNNDNTNRITNYKPTLVITILAKIVEKVTKSRLTDYLIKYAIILEQQFDFREKVFP